MSGKLHEFWLQVKGLFRRRQMHREMADELEFHQDLLRAKLLRDGVAEEDVEAAVRRRFGNSSRWQERLRELWQVRWVENFARDVSFAARLLRRSPRFYGGRAADPDAGRGREHHGVFDHRRPAVAAAARAPQRPAGRAGDSAWRATWVTAFPSRCFAGWRRGTMRLRRCLRSAAPRCRCGDATATRISREIT